MRLKYSRTLLALFEVGGLCVDNIFTNLGSIVVFVKSCVWHVVNSFLGIIVPKVSYCFISSYELLEVLLMCFICSCYCEICPGLMDPCLAYPFGPWRPKCLKHLPKILIRTPNPFKTLTI